MELICTCISRLVIYLTKNQPDMIPGQLKHYADPDDYNRIFYHHRNDDMGQTIQVQQADSDCPLEQCKTDFEETAGKNESVVTDYQFDKNTRTDSHFLQESLSAMEKSEEEIIPVTDGGYDGQDNIALAKERNIRPVTTALTGKEAPDALANFGFNEDGTRLPECAAGHEPISQSYTKTTGQCRVSFDRNHCAGCPYQDQCRPKIYKKVATFITSKNASNRAKSQRYMQNEEFSNLARPGNGTETIPANIRKNYHLDKLPGGKQRGKFFFGSKIAALNFRKLFGFRKGLGSYAQNPVLA